MVETPHIRDAMVETPQISQAAAAGQTRVQGVRNFVHADLYEPVVAALVERTRSLRLGRWYRRPSG